VRHADALRRFALAAAERGKPVIAYKLGRSAAARELAVSHTGALAGEDDVADVFLKACGIARVDTLDALIEGLPLLARVPPAARGAAKRVGVVTTTAGGATMVVDPLATRGVTIAPASTATLAKLAAAGIDVRPARLIDLTIAGARYDTMKAALDILLAAPEFDLVLIVVGSSARSQPDKTVQPIIDSAECGKPLAVFLAPEAPQALAMLSKAGVPSFHTPEAAADAIAAALTRRAPVATQTRSFKSLGSGGPVLDEFAAGTLLDRLGIARAPSVALDAGVTQAPALPFPYPVAVKVLSAEIAHKTDVGGVVLDIGDGEALIAAIRKIEADVATRKPGAKVTRVLVQPMLAGLGEALIGYRVDRDVGPLVMVAAGGVLAEIVRDRSLRLAPVTLVTAQEMIAEVGALMTLAGYRGRPKGDLGALAQAIVALSRLADDATVIEAEINPLIVRDAGSGVVAVDALVKLAESA
jgi:acetate---CoA ligase (ADP-forming)